MTSPRHVLSAIVLLAAVAAAQDEEWAAFRTQLDNALRLHNFFAKVKVTAVEHRPFLFYIEQAPDGREDHEKAVVHGYLPFLRELVAQWDQHYGNPLALTRSGRAPGYAIAVLSSAGRYLDFRTAIGDPSLANARAHYTPELRLAVTYQDTFAFGGSTRVEELHSLLHEVVHAMQHAHGKDDKMTAPSWFNEGLADYRSACTTLAASLREPPLQEHHLVALAFGYANRAGRPYVSPIADLVEPTSYAAIVERAKKRSNGAARPDLVLSLFYSQAEMFTRFLHEVDGGALKPQYLDYMRLVQQGGSGLATFQQAFACATPAQLTALEQKWLRWLDGVLRQRAPSLPSLFQDAPAGGPTKDEPLPPPIAFDPAGLAWQDSDFDERLAAVRRLCARGLYDAARTMMPDAAAATVPARKEQCERESERLAGILQLRQQVLDDLAKSKGQLALGDVRGRFVRRTEQGEIVLLVGKAERTMPLAALGPKELVREGNRLKAFAGRAVWLSIWLRWLGGERLALMKSDLAKEFRSVQALRAELTAEFVAGPGGAAEALLAMQSMPRSDDPKVAQQQLARLQELLAVDGRSPLLQARKDAIEGLARAYAERSFRPDDFSALGLTGAIETKDGVTTVSYRDAKASPNADFVEVPEADRTWFVPRPKLPYGGAVGLTPAGTGYQVAGTTHLRWAVPLRGAFRIEVVYRVSPADDGHLDLFTMVEDRWTASCHYGGSVQLLHARADDDTSIAPIGGGAQILTEAANTWVIEFDGTKTLVVTVNGKETARVDTRGHQQGELWLLPHCGSPMAIESITVRGTPDPRDPARLRDRFVARILGGLWK